MIFPERLKALHARTPERVAATLQFSHADDLPVTLDQLLRGSQAFAHTYAREGVQPGDVIVLILQHGDDLLYAFWGAILHGAIPSIMPFLTEELWSHLVGEGFIAGAEWPQPPAYEPPAGFAVFQELVGEIRRFRAEHGLAPRHPLEVVVADPEGLAATWWQAQLESLAAVAPQWVARPPAGPGRTRLVVGPLEAFVSLGGAADTSAERERLTRAVADAEGLLAGAEAKLGNPQFLERAPAAVVEKERARAAEAAARLAKLRAQLQELE